MKRATVIGSFGCGNKGDDAILDGLQQIIGNYYEIVPTLGNYGRQKQHDKRVEYLSLRLNEGFSASVCLSVISFFHAYLMELRKTDIVIIGGGSLLHDLTVYNLPFYGVLQTLAQMMHKKVYYIGVGAGPISTTKGKKWVRKYLNKCAGIIVRDPVDFGLLQTLGVNHVRLSVDNAFAGNIDGVNEESILRENRLNVKEYIVVTACQWFRSDNFWNREKMDFSKDILALKQSVVTLHNLTGKKIVFLPTVMHDRILGQRIDEMIKEDWFTCKSDDYSSREMAVIVAESYLVYGMRMHSLIFAIRAGIPFISPIYDEKVRNLVKRVGMEQYTMEIEEIDSPIFLQKVDQLINNYTDVCAKLSNASCEYRKIAKENIESMLLEND